MLHLSMNTSKTTVLDDKVSEFSFNNCQTKMIKSRSKIQKFTKNRK